MDYPEEGRSRLVVTVLPKKGWGDYVAKIHGPTYSQWSPLIMSYLEELNFSWSPFPLVLKYSISNVIIDILPVSKKDNSPE